jgi:hypothetical protein
MLTRPLPKFPSRIQFPAMVRRREGQRQVGVDGRVSNGSARFGLERTWPQIQVWLACATKHASLARWFQMGGTGLRLSWLQAKRVTQRSAIGCWNFIGSSKKVSRPEQSWILKGDGAYKGPVRVYGNVGCAVGTLHCWAGHTVAKFVEFDWNKARKGNPRIFAPPRRPCRANTTTAASGRREKP